jgi:hypothetical protein
LDGVPHATTLAPGAAVALAADRFYEPGRNVLVEPAPLTYVASALGGEVAWETGGSSQKLMQEKIGFEFQNPRLAPMGFEAIDWVSELRPSLVDLEAWPRVGASLRASDALVTSLASYLDPENLEEDRSLAARCLLALGDARLVAESFDDEAFQKFWPSHLAELRSAASRSPAGAERVFLAFTEKYDRGNGSNLFELVRGFPPEALGEGPEEFAQGPAPERLLPLLESQKLADRVLASLALEEVATLPASVQYDPTDPLTKRRSAVGRVRRLLAPPR